MSGCFSAYIHIPFCKSKCKYCSFVSYPDVLQTVQNEYIDALLKEIDYFYQGEILKTIYLGGGTPSLLDICDLSRILRRFKFNDDTEITIEINPETIDYKRIFALRQAGFNRVSIGIQAFDDTILKHIGRIHSSEKAKQAIENALAAGFSNVSADFIYGLPEQTLDSFVKDLKTAVSLGVSHISLYGLKIEEGCEYYIHRPQNIADDDTQADMYLAAIDLLEKSGFEHYEISNFAKKSKTKIYESKHNLNYWDAEAYYGFGAAAHGYFKDKALRYSNFSNLDEYIHNYKRKASQVVLTKQQQLEEKIFLGFRKGCGIDVAGINAEFNINFDELYSDVIKKYKETSYLLSTEHGYRLSDEGFLLSNMILADFMCF